MQDKERKNNPPKRGPMGRGVPEKPKNFASAITKLTSSLKNFKVQIFLSIILAGLSAVLALSSPNRLSTLTDEISKRYLHKQQITKNIIPVYLEVLYIPEFNSKLFLEHDYTSPPEDLVSPVKKVLLSGYAWRRYNYIYVEYLNLDGYLEIRVYNEYDYPNIFSRYTDE